MADSAAEDAKRRAQEILAEERRKAEELADKIQRERDKGSRP